MRFDRDFELIIGLGSEAVIVRPPLRISFAGDKSIAGKLNKLNLQVYNLREDRRLRLVKDAEDRLYIPLELRVGYRDQLERIFRGSIHRSATVRDGVDFVTSIECLDGGFDVINSYSSQTIDGGDYIKQLLQDMPNTREGKLAPGRPLTRPRVVVGPTIDLVRSGLTPEEYAYIEDETLNIIRKQNQVIDDLVPLVSPRTGLINTPEREQKKVTFQTLMNPTVKIGRRVQLESVTAPHLNGIYKAETISYSGDNYGDDWSQTITGFLAQGFESI